MNTNYIPIFHRLDRSKIKLSYNYDNWLFKESSTDYPLNVKQNAEFQFRAISFLFMIAIFKDSKACGEVHIHPRKMF